MLTKEILVELAKQDDEKVRELAEFRSKGEDPHFHEYLINQGVFYSTSYEELENRLWDLGVDILELGLDNYRVVENGWLFPAYDSKGSWMYWINYSNTRESNKKYLNVVQSKQKDKLVFGLDMLPDALDKNKLVWVEGVIDQCRLASYGVPTVATIGTHVTDYMKVLSRRVQSNIIIPDNDASEKTAIGRDFGARLQAELTNARTKELTYVKDIDDCYTDIPEQFFWLVDQLGGEYDEELVFGELDNEYEDLEDYYEEY